MEMLTFTAQLSLDFIFGGVAELPGTGEEVMSQSFDLQLGGGTLVYPIILSKLGVPCRVVVKKAASPHGEIACQMLKSHGIAEVEVVEVEEYDPVMSTAVVSMKSDRSFISKNDPRAFEYSNDFLIRRFKTSKIVFAMEKNLDLIPRIKENGSTVVFDVGWSEELSVEKYREVLKHVDYFTPNDKEAMKMTGTSTVEESLQVLSKYVKHTIISCGKKGCMTLEGDRIFHVEVPDGIKAVDTTGAGDNFMAGLIFGIYRGQALLDCMKMANCTGALSTTGLGCYGAKYTAEDVWNLFSNYDAAKIKSKRIV
ncbi:MAG: carbohydrate kinase family protein [Eubacterium sp.]|nr:carbohydrate kinase family protein [Eubacterium sp.]